MATTLKLKYNSATGQRPVLADIALRELAVNTTDGKLFLRKGNGTGTDKILDISVPFGLSRFESTTGAYDVYVDSTAKVGIGTLTPGDKLSVNGFITENPGDNVYYNVVTQKDIGISPNQVPLNQFLGQLAFINEYIPTGLAKPGNNNSYDITVDSSVNLKIGGTASRATTPGTNQLVLFNGTAPVGTLVNGCSIYSTSGEMRVMDASGNATLISPHDSETNEWVYDSVDTRTGRRLRVDMEKLVKFLDDYFGTDFVQETFVVA